MRFNLKYVQELINKNRHGKLIKLFKENIHEWSIDNYNTIYLYIIDNYDKCYNYVLVLYMEEVHKHVLEIDIHNLEYRDFFNNNIEIYKKHMIETLNKKDKCALKLCLEYFDETFSGIKYVLSKEIYTCLMMNGIDISGKILENILVWHRCETYKSIKYMYDKLKIFNQLNNNLSFNFENINNYAIDIMLNDDMEILNKFNFLISEGFIDVFSNDAKVHKLAKIYRDKVIKKLKSIML